MIQLAEDLEFLDSRKVPLNPKLKRIVVEVASNRKIDVAVVDAAQEREFEESPTGDEADIDWIESVRNYDFEFQFPENEGKYYLLFWNSNEKGEAMVAYKISPMTADMK